MLLVACQAHTATPGPIAPVAAPPPAPLSRAPSRIEAEAPPPPDDAWQILFDGQSLHHWKSTNFGGEGDVRVQDRQIVIRRGDPLSGITWTGGELPLVDYEISLEAMKVDGDDFFCALTFPVAKNPLSLVVGGWGGGLVGLSSLDGMDASENETTRVMSFAKNRWYRVRVRVTAAKVQAFIDNEKVVDAVITGRHIGIRPEVEASRPLGIATYNTGTAVRDIKIRRL
jgi:hypothetical protein